MSRRRASRARPAGGPSVLDEGLERILAARDARPAPGLPRRLDALFARLAMQVPEEEARELQTLVWALWTNHRDRRLDAAMEAASNALLEGRRDDARAMLDQLVADAPDWAEAWNKRAILAFSEDRDEDAVADILRVVELEPRHFGALAGLGQILARHGRAREAIAAFDLALAVNPHLRGLGKMVEQMRERERPRLN